MENFLWGLLNGVTPWIVLVAHVLGYLHKYPVYDAKRSDDWYDFGFLIGAGSPLLGFLGV